MQRWIGLKLAEQSGISANLDFMFPGALMKRLAGVKAGETSPWPEKQELIWNVFDKLRKLPVKPIYTQITNYLQNDHGNIKAYRLAGRIADTFDQYQVYRPEMIKDWLSPASKQTPEEDTDIWQKEMFRSVFPDRNRCKTVVFDRFIKDCRKNCPESVSPDTPIHVFGISVLPVFFIDMLRAASEHTDVYFYLLSPTRQYWGDSKTVREIRRAEKRSGKTASELYIEETHELLDNLGVIGRDFFDHLLGSDEPFIAEENYHDIDHKTLLNTIQAEILALEKTDNQPAYDNSIIVNSCHNPLREMETLYDTLLDLFEKDDSLTPSDILVMTPDIEKYTPYIKAVFDNPYSENSKIPYSIADVSERQANRPAGVFLELLELLTGDFSLSDVFKVLSYDIVAETFDINLSNLRTLASVMESSGAFWAHGSDHLKQQNLDITDIFTWKRALRRVALGLAEGSTGSIYNDAAAKDIPFSLASEIGGLMRFAERSEYFASELTKEKTVQHWCALMQEMAEDYLSGTNEYADDMMYLTSAIADITAEADGGGFKDQVNSEPVLERIAEILSEPRGAKGFMSGRVTFCAMLPMRSIPFKVIAVTGLDENTFPRQKVSLEFDLMAKHPKPGDRNNRDSDRYLFLETIISAREKLILSYRGQSERDNSELQPSTLITELLAHLSGRFGTHDIITHQKLHSFSREYFRGEGLYTYSPAKYTAAKAFAGDKAPMNFADKHIETEEITEITISEFESFFISPPEYFLKKTLGISPKIYGETLPDTEPLTLEGLKKYTLMDETVNSRLSGEQDTLEYQYVTAQLPPENLGEYFISETKKASSEIADKATNLLGGLPTSKETEITVDGLTIKGHIPGVAGNRHAYIRPAELKPKDLIRAWIRHLLLNKSCDTHTFTIGTNSEKEITPYSGDHLSELVRIFKTGRMMPLRFHISDAFLNSLPKGFKKDDYCNIKNDYAFHICFGDGYVPDEETAAIIITPIVKHLEGQA